MATGCQLCHAQSLAQTGTLVQLHLALEFPTRAPAAIQQDGPAMRQLIMELADREHRHVNQKRVFLELHGMDLQTQTRAVR